METIKSDTIPVEGAVSRTLRFALFVAAISANEVVKLNTS